MLWATADYAPSAHFYPALSRDPSPRVYSCKAGVTWWFQAFDFFVVVSWGELTSSKLQAPGYEEAGITRPLGALGREEGLTHLKLLSNASRLPTTDHRLPTTNH